MKIKTFIVILPGIVSLLSYFIPSLTYPLKIIIPLFLTALYFLGLGVILQFKLNNVQSNISILNSEFDKLKHEKDQIKSILSNYDEFVHKRKLFIDFDLKELSDLITEYEGYVKNSYRGQKYQEVRDEAGSVKKKTLEIIKKEVRDFYEQLYNVQSDKDNR